MNSAEHIERAIGATISGVARASLFRGACQGAAVGLAIAGVGVLVGRLGFDLPVEQSLWAGVAVPIAAIAGAFAARTKLTPDEARAWLDDRCNCGGMLMLSSEEWSYQSIRIVPPRVRWFDRPLGIKLGVLAWFVLGALLIPMSAGNAQPRGFDLEPVVNTLAEEVELLEEIEAIEPDEAEKLTEELEALARLAQGDDPLRTWEALDHARQELDRLAEQAGDDLADQASRSSAIEEFAAQLMEMLEQSPEGLTEEQAETVRRALEELDDPSLSESVREAIQQLNQSLSESQSQQQNAAQGLCEAAGQCSAGSMAGMNRLASGGMIDPSRLRQASIDRAAAQQALRELMQGYREGECEGGAMLSQLAGMCAGRGGISRGPGAATLTWRNQPTTLDDAAFDPLAVDSAGIDQEQSVFISDGAAIPDGEQAGAGSSGGAIDASRAADSRSATPLVLPRHREAVRRYFERADTSEEPGE